MLEESVINREEHLLRLGPFCQALGQALSRSGLTLDQALGIWHTAVMAHCTQCGAPVLGEELFALSQPSDDHSTPKIRRLSLGDCSQPGCDSYFYRLTFRPHPPLDWPGLIAQAEGIQAERARTGSAKPWTMGLARGVLRCGLTRRAVAALAMLLALLLVRHWYAGGRIPLLREPENFQVTPALEESPSAETSIKRSTPGADSLTVRRQGRSPLNG